MTVNISNKKGGKYGNFFENDLVEMKQIECIECSSIVTIGWRWRSLIEFVVHWLKRVSWNETNWMNVLYKHWNKLGETEKSGKYGILVVND